MKILLLNTTITLILLSGCSSQYSCEIDSAFSDVTPMVQEATSAFEKAEKEILDVTPEDLSLPDPDPAKCVCKGTGLIKQGDGHVTKCPYHGNSSTIQR